MAKFRMVPEDAEEAQHIAKLLETDVQSAVPELASDKSEIPLEVRLRNLHKRQGWLYRWQDIASDLADEDALDKDDEPAKPPPAPRPRSTARDVTRPDLVGSNPQDQRAMTDKQKP